MANVLDAQNLQKELEGSWTLKMAEFERRLKAASTPTNPTLVQLQEEFFAFKEVVLSMLNLLQQQVRDCLNGIDAINMWHRKKALLFSGISESPNVDLKQEILQLVQSKMGLSHITGACLKQCSRLGIQHSDRIRPVLVYFYNHQTKAEVWKSKSKLKGSVFSVSEFLTKERQSIHKRARKHFGMKNVWSTDGVIYVKHSGGREKIFTQEELDALILKFPMTSTPGSSGVISKAVTDRIKPITAHHSSSNIIRQPEAAQRKSPSAVIQCDDAKRSRRLASKK